MKPVYSRYSKLETLVRLLHVIMRKLSGALVIHGPPGIGKSTAVAAAIAEAGLTEDQYVYAATQMTPLQFFIFISKHSNKLVLLDDTSGSLGHPLIQAIIKNMLWPNPATKKCTVKWASKTSILKNENIGDSFDFTGQVIFITNQNTFGNRSDAAAIRSRVLDFYFDLTFEERKDLIQEISVNNDEYGLSAEQMKNLVDFILENVTPATPDFDLRMPKKFAPIVLAADGTDAWKKDLAHLLNMDERYILIKRILEAQEKEGFGAEEEVRRYAFAMEEEGLKGSSRATYFSLKAKWFPNYKRNNPAKTAQTGTEHMSAAKRKPGRPPKKSETQSNNLALLRDAHDTDSDQPTT